jgi:hypothetical protein
MTASPSRAVLSLTQMREHAAVLEDALQEAGFWTYGVQTSGETAWFNARPSDDVRQHLEPLALEASAWGAVVGYIHDGVTVGISGGGAISVAPHWTVSSNRALVTHVRRIFEDAGIGERLQ